nr:MAG TPA: hypothetical protein [Caudoviricetes sp.]
MKLIKQISNDIAENISEAKDKIRTAYELKAESPEAAAWYREMASAHLGFNSKGHEVSKKLIETYKSSEEYKRNPAYADGMLCAWTAIHDELIAKTAEVKAMVDGFK